MFSLCVLDYVHREGKYSTRVRELAFTRTPSKWYFSNAKSQGGPDLTRNMPATPMPKDAFNKIKRRKVILAQYSSITFIYKRKKGLTPA